AHGETLTHGAAPAGAGTRPGVRPGPDEDADADEPLLSTSERSASAGDRRDRIVGPPADHRGRHVPRSRRPRYLPRTPTPRRTRPPRSALEGDRRTAGPVGTHPAAPRGEGALAREHRLHRPPPAPPAGDLRGAGAGRRSHRHRSARVGTGCRTGRPAARG